MRKTVFALLSIAIGAFLALASVEIGMRVLGISYPIFFVPHPVAGARMRPNLKAWYTLEGQGFIEVNSIGFRDVEHEKTKPDGEFRIALLGDSYTGAMQVPFEDTYWSVARRALADCEALSGRTPVPMNFGLSGIGTAQQLEILRSFVWDYDPDLVVLAFVSNDFTDNHPAYGGVGRKPFYVFDEAGEFVLDDSFRMSPEFLARMSPGRVLLRSLIWHSRTLQLLVEIRASMHRSSALEEAGARGGVLNRPPESETLREAWRITETAITRVAAEAASHGSDFLLFTVTTGYQVHPDAAYRKNRIAEKNGGDLYYWNKRLAEFAAAEKIDFADLSETFLAHAEANQTCLHGFENSVPCGGHWNSEGHRLAGEEIADAICLQLAARKSDVVRSSSPPAEPAAPPTHPR